MYIGADFLGSACVPLSLRATIGLFLYKPLSFFPMKHWLSKLKIELKPKITKVALVLKVRHPDDALQRLIEGLGDGFKSLHPPGTRFTTLEKYSLVAKNKTWV